MKLWIINGPNLNLLGKREPDVYGDRDFEGYLEELRGRFPEHEIAYFQSNVEGELIDKLHEVGFSGAGIVLNAAAYTHTSVGIGDAVKGIEAPVVEVHISNTHAREPFRHNSHIAAHAHGVILGFGLKGYELAVRSLIGAH